MSDQADLDELAQRYLDLWQDQVSALAADPDFATALQRIVTSLGLAAAAAPAAWPAWPAGTAGLKAAGEREPTRNGEDAERTSGSNAAAGAQPAAGAAAVAPASDRGGADLDELSCRLAALEERVAALERRGPGRRRSPAKQPGPRRS